MEMTEEFSRVNVMFHEAWNQALMSGRAPYKILFGPEEFKEWVNLVVKSQPNSGVSPFVKDCTFYGLVVRRMCHKGVALITESIGK